MKAIDLTGQRFGRLVALSAHTNSNGRRVWLCQCDCGKQVEVTTGSLRSGGTKSCGCLHAEYQDLSGQRFGRLLVLKRTDDKVSKKGKHHIAWLCKCDCGNDVVVRCENLKNGSIRSCGCLHRESPSKRFSMNIEGQKFGRLTVKHRAGTQLFRNGEKKSLWHCICDCGTEIDVIGKNLVNGNTQSCGCLISRGEEQTRIELNALHIKFTPQYKFNDLIGPGGAPLRFDFAIFNASSSVVALIEYHGKQHYFERYGWFGKQQREVTDELKRKYCEDNAIPLLVISYKDNIQDALQTFITSINCMSIPCQAS